MPSRVRLPRLVLPKSREDGLQGLARVFLESRTTGQIAMSSKQHNGVVEVWGRLDHRDMLPSYLLGRKTEMARQVSMARPTLLLGDKYQRLPAFEMPSKLTSPPRCQRKELPQDRPA